LNEIPPDWLEEFEAAAQRPLEHRWKYAFIKTYKPVLDAATLPTSISGFKLDFLRHELLRPIGFEKAVATKNDSPRLPAPLARYRPKYPFPGCVPAEPEPVFPGSFNVPLCTVRCIKSLDAGVDA